MAVFAYLLAFPAAGMSVLFSLRIRSPTSIVLCIASWLRLACRRFTPRTNGTRKPVARSVALIATVLLSMIG